LEHHENVAGAAPRHCRAGRGRATVAGISSSPSVSVDARGRLAMGWVRTLGRERRAEVRHGTLRGGVRSRAIVLDRSTHNVDTVAVAFTPDGVLAAAWRRYLDGAQRVRGATVSTDGSTSGPFELTPDGRRSAYRDGTTVVAWTERGRVLAAQAPAGLPFGPAAQLSGAGFSRAPQLTVTRDGDVVAAWLSNAGQGNAVDIAVRPPAGAFGAATQVVGPAQSAFGARLAATSAGEVLLAWINTNAPNGFTGERGTVRLQRLGADERPVGPRIQLSPDGIRASAPVLVHDGAGSALAGWAGSRSGGGAVQVRRIVPGGILGPVRTLSRGGVGTSTPALAAVDGRAVATWVAGGDVRYSLYR
jgi:hypothetical protein